MNLANNAITIDELTGIITNNISNTLINSAKITHINTATYNVLSADYYLSCLYTTTGAITNIQLMTNLVTLGKTFVIKDVGGLAGTNNITITTEGSETINGAATLVINTNYASVLIYSNGTNWLAFNIINENELSKIDKLAVSGLLGTNNSLAYKVHEIEKHFHNYERWFGLSPSPSGEVKRADLLATTVAPFQIDAANNDWGSWLQILGSSDTPTNIGGTYTKFDLHSVQVVANERAQPYYVQFAFGDTAAGALTAGTYTSMVIACPATNTDEAFKIMMNRVNAGTKAWARCKCVGQNTATLDFYFGIHEYVG